MSNLKLIRSLKEKNNQLENLVSQILISKGVILVPLKEAYSKYQDYLIGTIRYPTVREVPPPSLPEKKILKFNLEGNLSNWDMVEFYTTEEEFNLKISLCAVEFANNILPKFTTSNDTIKFLVCAKAKRISNTLDNTVQGNISSFTVIPEHYQEKFIFDILYDIKEVKKETK